MNSERPAAPQRYLNTVVAGWDFKLGIAFGVVASLLCISSAVRTQGVTLALASGAVCVGLLGVVLTALAVITAFFDGHYRRVLEHAGGIRRAMAPYLVIATASAVGAGAALLTALAWPVLSVWAQALAFGVTAGVTIWVVAGMASLVELTIFHAEQRAALMRGIEEAADVRAARLTSSSR